ncbi:MAG: hypothetical protein AAFY99_12965 [Pseudomonadota bacterium]
MDEYTEAERAFIEEIAPPRKPRKPILFLVVVSTFAVLLIGAFIFLMVPFETEFDHMSVEVPDSSVPIEGFEIPPDRGQ